MAEFTFVIYSKFNEHFAICANALRLFGVFEIFGQRFIKRSPSADWLRHFFNYSEMYQEVATSAREFNTSEVDVDQDSS